MTHEELLAKLWILPVDVTELQHGAKAVQALRSVVELHKPFETIPPWGGDGYLACSRCDEYTNDGLYMSDYPCPTIQAIEKELANG